MLPLLRLFVGATTNGHYFELISSFRFEYNSRFYEKQNKISVFRAPFQTLLYKRQWLR